MLSRSPWERFRSDRRAVACLLILCAELLAVLLLPPLLGLEPNASDLGAGFWAPPSAAHPLGTDDVGRDLLARLLCGGRVSLLIGLCSAALSALVGIPLGLLAGYRRGAWEFCLMRLADVFQSFPSIVLVLCLVSLVGPSALNLVLVLGLLHPYTAQEGSEGRRRSVEQVKEFQRRFTQQFHLLNCRELLAERGLHPTPTAQAVGADDHCGTLIVSAVELLCDYLAELDGQK